MVTATGIPLHLLHAYVLDILRQLCFFEIKAVDKLKICSISCSIAAKFVIQFSGRTYAIVPLTH